MLKGIPEIITPELLHVLAEMGHTDELTIGDGNFPGHTYGKRVIRMDGHGVPEILDAILKLFPLDTYVDAPVTLMQVVPGDNVDPVIWKDYEKVIRKHESDKKIENIGRFEFYDRAKKCYAVVATGESALYANIILKKGVVK